MTDRHPAPRRHRDRVRARPARPARRAARTTATSRPDVEALPALTRARVDSTRPSGALDAAGAARLASRRLPLYDAGRGAAGRARPRRGRDPGGVRGVRGLLRAGGRHRAAGAAVPARDRVPAARAPGRRPRGRAPRWRRPAAWPRAARSLARRPRRRACAPWPGARARRPPARRRRGVARAADARRPLGPRRGRGGGRRSRVGPRAGRAVALRDLGRDARAATRTPSWSRRAASTSPARAREAAPHARPAARAGPARPAHGRQRLSHRPGPRLVEAVETIAQWLRGDRIPPERGVVHIPAHST